MAIGSWSSAAGKSSRPRPGSGSASASTPSFRCPGPPPICCVSGRGWGSGPRGRRAGGGRTSPAVWLDPEYGVVRIITRVEGPDGAKVGDVAFSEHRKVSAGFFYPFRQELFLDSKLLEVASVRSVEGNTGLSDSLFDPDALLKGTSR